MKLASMLMDGDPTTLARLTAALLFFCSTAWLLMGLPMKIARRAAMLLALANLLLGCATEFLLHYGDQAGYLGHQLPALLSLIGISLFRSGVRGLSRQLASLREDGIICLLAAAAMFSIPSDQASATIVLTVISFPLAWVAARAALDCLGATRKAVGETIALAVASPFIVFAAMFLLRGIVLWIEPGINYTGAAFLNSAAIPFMWLYLVLMASLNQTAIALILSRLATKVRLLAHRDALTDQWNRRAIMSRLREEKVRWQRTGDPFAVVMFDLDHFKAINDELGHAGGDAALRHASAVVAASLRSLDALGRFGGEEFLVLLPMTELNGACNAAERMRSALASTPLQWEGKEVPLTASFGVNTCGGKTDSVERVVQGADEAMYHAKRDGRNRVALHVVMMDDSAPAPSAV